VPQNGLLFDGVSGRAYSVLAEGAGDKLWLQSERRSEEITASALKTISRDAKRLRIGRDDIEGWSLLLDQPVSTDIDALAPKTQRYGRLIDRVGLVPALGIGAAITAVIVGVGYVAPGWIAPHIPMSWERKVGGTMVGDFGKFRCRDAKGQQALEALVERVAPGGTKGPDAIKIAALDVPAFNAAALPGGYIVVFKPAITQTDPESLAGIIAHEVAHVRRRHVTTALIRELGIGSLFGLLGGNMGANAEQIVALSYTRQDEEQADSDAIQMLESANITPQPTASLFRRLSEDAPQFSTEFLQSHPLSAKRAERFAASYDYKVRYEPALSDLQEKALIGICNR